VKKTLLIGLGLLLAGPILQAAPGLDAGAARRLGGLQGNAANCQIQNNETGQPLAPGANGDALFKLLSAQSACPQNALLFRQLLIANKLTSRPAMVANRGFSNPLPQGSFSFFEGVTGQYGTQQLAPGDWFFGHFTAASFDSVAMTSTLVPQQAATPDNLLLETLVWDPVKSMFNFYEIRGTGQGGQWFYRGDSADIQADIQNLNRNRDPAQPLFMGAIKDGQAGMPRLRCSGCHMNGGPIMKELAAPHDSWWTRARPLSLGAMRIAPEFTGLLAEVVSADEFAQWIKAGGERLLRSAPYWRGRQQLTLQEQLRPLFCAQEVNLESDLLPLSADDGIVAVPLAAFVDPRLAPDGARSIPLRKALYVNALNLFRSQFFDYQTSSIANGVQPIGQIDADHAYEVPVKSHSDIRLVQGMVANGLIDDKFVYDVLSIDMTRPLLSERRCRLLRLLPDGVPTSNWRQQFQQNLAASVQPAAQTLLANLRDPRRTPQYHRDQARQVIDRIRNRMADQQAVNGYVRLLAQERIAVYQAQLSQHPQGQIFEPGFRLIFPTMQLLQKNQNQIAYGGVPGQYWLNPATGAVELGD
jgi:hypothetical protein